jgi:cytochrome c553
LPDLSLFADYDMTRPLTIAACLALASIAFATAAQDAAPAPATSAAPPAAAPTSAAAAPAPVKGDPARGLELTYTCHGCHGVVGYRNAYPNYRVPLIAGQSEQYLVNALTDYKNGARKHPTMQAQALSFSQQDIADIAAYLSNVK